jgi:hypothetical protein
VRKAARLSLAMSARRIRSSRRKWLPNGRRDEVFLMVSMSSAVISIASSIGSFASSTTIAVMILVIDAIGAAWSAFFEKSVWPLVGSKTRTPWDWRLGSPSLVNSADETLATRLLAGLSAAVAYTGSAASRRAATKRFTVSYKQSG